MKAEIMPAPQAVKTRHMKKKKKRPFIGGRA
jgi:hypothetical protein